MVLTTKRLIGAWLLSAIVLAGVVCDEHDHSYETNEEVVLWVNTVGPYHNRQETYPYFSLPYCVGPKPSINHYHETLGKPGKHRSNPPAKYYKLVSKARICSVLSSSTVVLTWLFATISPAPTTVRSN